MPGEADRREAENVFEYFYERPVPGIFHKLQSEDCPDSQIVYEWIRFMNPEKRA